MSQSFSITAEGPIRSGQERRKSLDRTARLFRNFASGRRESGPAGDHHNSANRPGGYSQSGQTATPRNLPAKSAPAGGWHLGSDHSSGFGTGLDFFPA